jgi:hypothetical protein
MQHLSKHLSKVAEEPELKGEALKARVLTADELLDYPQWETSEEVTCIEEVNDALLADPRPPLLEWLGGIFVLLICLYKLWRRVAP